MKRYKLLKDTPTIKAGTIFEEASDFDGIRELVRIVPAGTKMIKIYPTIQDIYNFDEWFEEIQKIQEEPTNSIHWKPKRGDTYWIIYSDGDIDYDCWNGNSTDIARYEMGSIYRTEEECKKARDRKLVKARLRRTSMFEPDWKNGYGGWIVGYSYTKKELETIYLNYFHCGALVHYRTKEDAEKSIRENREDWLTYFGIKEKTDG